MATAKREKSGNFRVRIYTHTTSDGKKHYKSFTAPTKKEAEYLASDYLYNCRTDKEKNLTVNEAIENYISLKSPVLSPSTKRCYLQIKNTYFGNIKEINIYKLKQSDIQKEINLLVGKLSTKTINNIFSLLLSALKEYQLFFNVKYPQKIKKQMFIPSEEEMKKIYKLAEGKKIYLPILLGSMLGLRRSEICALKYSDIDFENKTIYIHSAVVKNDKKEWVIKTTKTESGTRMLRIPQKILDILNPDGDPEQFIVGCNPNYITKNYYKIAKKLNLKETKFHSLRHYYASILLKIGVPPRYAIEFTGHSSTQILEKVYQHTFNTEKQKYSKQIEKYFKV